LSGEKIERGLRMKRFLCVAAAAAFVLVPTAAQADPGFYEGPIFGISTGADGTLLVADGVQGVVNGVTGDVIAELPGLTDVDPIAGTDELWALAGAGEDPEEDTGQALWRIDGDGVPSLVVNLFEFEAKSNPHPATVDSNPFDVEDLGGGEALVADAGANALLKVDKHGKPKVVAVLPDELVSTANFKSLVGCPDGPPDICVDMPAEIPGQPVSTSVAIGPGAFYVGELKGFPAPIGESKVWRVEPNARNAKCGHSPLCTVALDGFTSIIDLVFGPDGRLYVTQINDLSWLAMEFALEGAPFPIAGSVYACNLATDDTKAECDQVVSGVPILTAITFRAGGLWGAHDALLPSADVDPLPVS
jgi:hypothetical protein